MVINILDHVKTASTYEDGEVIYQLISNALHKRENIILSFNAITSVPSAFINASLIRLLEEFSIELIREKITFINTTKHINELIRSRFAFVVSKKKL